MDRWQKLFDQTKKTMTDIELQQILREPDYHRFHREVEKLVEAGSLTPVKSSGVNGRIPPLYNKYRIIKPHVDHSVYLPLIRRLHPVLNISGYLQKPEVYQKHREIVEGLSNYLWYSKELLAKPMARKERSFSVWGREKLLDEDFALVKEVLKFNGLAEKFLNYYDTPEPFFEYVHSRSHLKTVLIIENKDTWFTFRKLMQETGKNIIAGTKVDVLLYGEGNKISKHGALEEYRSGMLGGEEGEDEHFLYFGDLDREGIRLFFRAREANPALDIRPFAALYRLMLELAENATLPLPPSPDQRELDVPLGEFISLLGLDEAKILPTLLTAGQYIPQEIVNYQVAAGILT